MFLSHWSCDKEFSNIQQQSVNIIKLQLLTMLLFLYLLLKKNSINCVENILMLIYCSLYFRCCLRYLKINYGKLFFWKTLHLENSLQRCSSYIRKILQLLFIFTKFWKLITSVNLIYYSLMKQFAVDNKIFIVCVFILKNKYGHNYYSINITFVLLLIWQ